RSSTLEQSADGVDAALPPSFEAERPGWPAPRIRLPIRERRRSVELLRPALTEPSEVAEGSPARPSATGDALRRRLLAAGGVAAAAIAFALAVSILGGGSLGLGAVVAIAMVIPVCKLAGLYDRDQHLIHKSTLDEAPVLLSVAALYSLLVFFAGDKIVEGTF